MKVAEVSWEDAWVESDSMSIKKATKSKAIVTHTIGYLVSETEHGITLATDIYEKDKKTVKIVNFIPHCMILEWWVYD